VNAFRFLHCADLHLDSPFSGLKDVPSSLRQLLKRSTFAALDKVIRLAIQEHVDFVLIAGDIYDAADRSLRAQLRFQRAVERLSEHGIQVYIVHGNHDPLEGRTAKLAWPNGVHVFGADQPETKQAVCSERGILAQIHGMSYRTASVEANLAALLAAQPRLPDVYQIGLLHANVDGDAAHDNYAPCSKRELLASGIDYWALGHIHTRVAMTGEGDRDGTAVVYPGNTQGRSVRECGPKGCYIVHVNEHGSASLTFHETGVIRWAVEEVFIEGLDSEQDVKDELEARIDAIRRQAGGRPSIVRFVLRGRGQAHDLLRTRAALAELLAELREAESLVPAADDPFEDDHPNVGVMTETRAEFELAGLGDNADDGFVWIESIVDRTGRAFDADGLLQQNNMIGDLLRMSRHLQSDHAAMQSFREVALDSLASQPKAAKLLLPGSDEAENWNELLQEAEQMLLDALADGGWSG